MGGAKNCPETPRQKMIGMMYLVLTAMLALNVSTDILSGFTMVDNSLHASIEASNKRNENMYLEFEHKANTQGEKAEEWYQKALQVRERADLLYNHLQKFKEDLAIMADGQAKFDEKKAQGVDPTLHIEGNSNMDVTGTYAIVQGNGQILKDSVASYSNFLVGMIDVKADSTGRVDSARVALRHSIQATLATGRGYNAHDKDSVDWEVAVFDGMPIGASMAVLSKMQNDVRTTEGQIVQYLMSQIGATELQVNKISAFILPKSTNIIRGGKYEAKIVLAALDTTQVPDFYVNNIQLPVEGAYGEYTAECPTSGLQHYEARLVVTNPKTQEKTELIVPGEYMVSEPTATISNTELNVMYRGYRNKFSVSVPGVATEDVAVTASGASVSKDGRNWIIVPSGGNNVTVTVTANGVTMAKQDFRVKPVPKPSAFLKVGDNQYDGSVPVVSTVLSNPNASIVASYGQDGLLDLKFQITGFKLFHENNYLQSDGSKFSSAQLAKLKNYKEGKSAIITDIKAKGPDGKDISLPPLIIKVK